MNLRRLVLALIIGLVIVQVLLLHDQTATSMDWPIKEYVLRRSFEDTGAENTVTAIYLTYRYYDTLFESLMVIYAMIGVVYLSVHEHTDS